MKKDSHVSYTLSVRRTLLHRILLLLLILFSYTAQSQNLEVITSTPAKEGEYAFAQSLDEIHTGEKWGWHSGKVGNATATSTLESNNVSNYQVENLHDLNLKTAWVEGDSNYGTSESFTFLLSSDEPFNYENFDGVIEVFNGYCKSESIWKANSRVKRLKMYYNNVPVCIVELADTWQHQSFTIQKFFVSHKYPDAPFTLSDGSRLKFEIIAIYAGDKYNDVAISEFVTPSYGGG